MVTHGHSWQHLISHFRSGDLAESAFEGDPVQHVDLPDGRAAQLRPHAQAGHRARRREQGELNSKVQV